MRIFSDRVKSVVRRTLACFAGVGWVLAVIAAEVALMPVVGR